MPTPLPYAAPLPNSSGGGAAAGGCGGRIVTSSRGRAGGDDSRPRASTTRIVAQRCLHGSPNGPKYGQEHEASRRDPRIRRRTRYVSVPRTLATTSPGTAFKTPTRPLAKYDCPRARTPSAKTRATFWAIPIIPSQLGRDMPGPALAAHATRGPRWARPRPADVSARWIAES